MKDQKEKIENLEKRREVQVVDTEKGCGRTGEKNSSLVDGIIDGIEGAVVSEWSGSEGE